MFFFNIENEALPALYVDRVENSREFLSLQGFNFIENCFKYMDSF